MAAPIWSLQHSRADSEQEEFPLSSDSAKTAAKNHLRVFIRETYAYCEIIRPSEKLSCAKKNLRETS